MHGVLHKHTGRTALAKGSQSVKGGCKVPLGTASGTQNLPRRHTKSSLQPGGDTALCSREITSTMTNGGASERECSGKTLGGIGQNSALTGRLDTVLCLCNGFS